MANKRKPTEEKKTRLISCLEFPKWLWELGGEVADHYGIARANVFKRWVIEGARAEFPHRVPTVADSVEVG